MATTARTELKSTVATLRATGREPLTTFEKACLAVVALAFVARIPYIVTPSVIWDSAWYLLLARSFGETGTFYLPWSLPHDPLYNGYWPPLFPIFASPFVKVFGASYSTLVIVSVTASALLCGAVFYATRDLMGRARAFAATAAVAAQPAFLVTDSSGMSESLLACMVTLTVWAFLKSLRNEKWLPVAGVFAFLAYLGKASLGLPFVGAGVAAVVGWRVWTRGFRATLRNPVDLTVIGLGLAGLLVLGATRTSKFGGVGLGLIEPLRLGVLRDTFLPVFAFKVFFAAIFLLTCTLPFSLRIREALRAPRSEQKGALLLASFLPLLLGAVFTATFYHTEGRPLVDFDNIRYLTPAIVPFLWLVLPHYDLDSKPAPAGTKGLDVVRRHRIWFATAVGALAVVFLLNPMAPVNTLTRLKVFTGLALLPIALAMVVMTTHYAVSTRRVGGQTETRYVPAPAPGGTGTALLGLGVLAVALAWFVSAWFAYAAIALAVASVSRSPQARAIAFIVLLMCATVPTARTHFPAGDAAAVADELLPPGTVLAHREPIVYFAAVAPDDVTLRLFYGDEIPADAEALIVQHDIGEGNIPGWRLVQGWDYSLKFYPTVAIEQWLEKTITGRTPIVPEIRAFSLFVREDGSTI